MINYLGPSMGPQGPVSATLPPALPGTMPGGIPGVSPVGMPILPRSGPPPSALAAIMRRPPGGPTAAAPPEAPPPIEYGATTQEDGSILLHVKNPDGTLGPVVKVLPPIKALGDHPTNPKEA